MSIASLHHALGVKGILLIAMNIFLIGCSAIPDGLVKRYYEYGEDKGKLQSEETYKNGKLEGMCTYYMDYTPESTIRITQFREGKKEGVEKYYRSGKLMIEFPYKNNRRNGIEKQYFPSGKLVIERLWTNGEVGGNGFNRRYYENGKLEFEFIRGNTKGEATKIVYYEDGNLKTEEPYKDGYRSGIVKTYYESGKLRSEYTYKDGILNGMFKLYSEDGVVEETGNYVYGAKVRAGVAPWKYWLIKVLHTLIS